MACSCELEAHMACNLATGVGSTSFVNLDLQQDIQELLSELKVIWHASLAHDSITLPADCSTETICAWVAAGKEGDTEALAHLFQLQNSISSVLSSTGMEISSTMTQVSVGSTDKSDIANQFSCMVVPMLYQPIQLKPSMLASACDATANPTHWHAQPSSVSSDPPLHLPTPASTQ